jgi:hypothetical protein
MREYVEFYLFLVKVGNPRLYEITRDCTNSLTKLVKVRNDA